MTENSNNKNKEIICILCPLGCKMQVTEKENQQGELQVRGHQCKLGREYAYEEYHNPTRTLTSTVVVHQGTLARLPVKTDRPIPKDQINTAVQRIAAVEIEAPIAIGQVIIEDILGSGANVIATRTLKHI